MISIKEILTPLKIPTYEGKAETEEGVTTPFFIIYNSEPQIIYADGIVYHMSQLVTVELYEEKENQEDIEKRVEEIFKKNNIAFTKENSLYEVEKENLFLCRYEMEV